MEKKTKQDSASDADSIWEEIKDKKIEIFSLPSQTVSLHCKPVKVEPTKLYLVANATSLLPILETALGESFSIDRFDKYITVERKK